MTCSGANRTLPGVVWAEHSLPHRVQGAPLASTVRSTRRCLWRWSCCPGNCSSSVTQGSESNCCQAQPREQPGDGPPGLHWGPSGTKREQMPQLSPQCCQRIPRAFRWQVPLPSLTVLPEVCSVHLLSISACFRLRLPPAKFKDTHMQQLEED